MTPHPTSSSRRWWILAVLGLAQLMVVLDATVVNIALPSAQHALGFSDDARQWVVTAYALSFGGLLLFGGRLGDLLGRRRMLIAGLAGFALASAVGGAAPSFGVLVAARTLQGVFGAILAPAGLGLLTTTFTDPAERGKAFGIYGAIAGGGGAIGLLLGGALTQYLSWRYCMYVNLIFAVPAIAGALAVLRGETATTERTIDLPGTVTATGGLFAIVFGFSQAQTHSWGSPVVLGFLGAGALLLAAFMLIEQRVEHPLLPLRVVLDRTRGGSYLAIGLSAIGMFGVFLFLTYYLQQTLGFSPITTGLAFLPMVAGIVLSSTVASAALLPRTGPRPLIPVGMLLAAGGLVLLTQIGLDSSYWTGVLPGIVVIGLGMGLIMAPAMNSSTAEVRPEDASVASAMTNTMQQIGGSIGTALLSTIAASAASTYAKAGHPAALAAVHSYTVAFGVSAAIFAAAALITVTVLRSGAAVADPSAPVLAH